MQTIKQYPVLIMGLVQAILTVAIAFGVTLTQNQTAAVLGVSAAALALLTHTQVSSKV